MSAYRRSGPASMSWKAEAGDNGFITVNQPEGSPLAFTVTYIGQARAFRFWLENFVHADGRPEAGATVDVPIDAPGFDSYSDSGHINFGGGAGFFHDDQIKVAVLHFRGERPPGSQRNDNTRDLYIWRSGIFIASS